eukprot:5947398-Amphidinium_carterae.1
MCSVLFLCGDRLEAFSGGWCALCCYQEQGKQEPHQERMTYYGCTENLPEQPTRAFAPALPKAGF